MTISKPIPSDLPTQSFAPKPATYSPESEILSAVLFGSIAFTITCSLILTAMLIAGPDFYLVLADAGRSLFMAIVVFVFWFVVIATFGMLQSALIAVPASKILSKGLENDARRSLAFYMITGALIGGTPWWILSAFVFDRSADWGSIFVVTVPGFVVGMVAGWRMKYRLGKLLSDTSKVSGTPEVAS